MAMQIGETMIPCRTCKAAHGENCVVTEREDKAPLRLSIGGYRDPHKKRINDAKKVSELLDW